jgi:hypothetical protein
MSISNKEDTTAAIPRQKNKAKARHLIVVPLNYQYLALVDLGVGDLAVSV